MRAGNQDLKVPQYHALLIQEEPGGQFTARAAEFPEIRATAVTEQEAVEKARQILADYLATARLVWVELPTPPTHNPALAFAGHAKDDPCFAEYLEEIARFRREEDECECSDSSSTPTT